MGFTGWFANNAFELLSAIGVVGSLWFTAISLRSETKTRRIENLLSITASHREVWKIFMSHKELARVNDPAVNTALHPITLEERLFVNMVIQQINSVYRTMNDHLVVKVEGLRRDVAQFLSLPIPREVWDKIKVVQNEDFVEFIESCRNWK